MIAFGIFSVGCFLYPTISNQINEHYNESTINEYNRNVNTSSDSEIHAELQMAAQYNKVIATDFFDGGNEEYEKILNDPELFMHIGNCICKWLCMIKQLQS